MRKWDSSLFDLPCAVHVDYNEAVSPAAETALIAGKQFLRPSKAVRPTSREKGRCEGPAFTHTSKNADHYNSLQRMASLHLCLDIYQLYLCRDCESAAYTQLREEPRLGCRQHSLIDCRRLRLLWSPGTCQWCCLLCGYTISGCGTTH